MRVYKHYRPREAWLPLIILGVLGIGALGGFLWSAWNGFAAEPPFPIFLVVLVVAAVNIWVVGRSAIEIRLEDDGFLDLVGPLRTVRVLVEDIVSIAPSDAMHGRVYILKHRNGKARFDPRLDGMHELITEIKRRNPAVELRGI